MGNGFVGCFGSGLDHALPGLEMLVRGDLRCGEEQGGCGLGRGSREAAPGLDAGRGKSPKLLLATLRWLAWLGPRAWAKD